MSERTQQARAWSIGLDLVYGLLGMGLIGWLLDWWLGTGPVLMLVLGGLGLVGGGYRFVKEAIALNQPPPRRPGPGGSGGTTPRDRDQGPPPA